MDGQSEPLRMERALVLISLFLQERLTLEEHDELDEWLMESDYNLNLFETLTHPENQNGLQRIIESGRLYIAIPYDGECINALVIQSDENRYQVWINGVHQFTLAVKGRPVSEADWFVIEENKYVPYAEEIGREIEKHFL